MDPARLSSGDDSEWSVFETDKAFAGFRRTTVSSRRIRKSFWSLAKLACAGSFVGGCFALLLIALPALDVSSESCGGPGSACATSQQWKPSLRSKLSLEGITSYLNLFGSPTQELGEETTSRHRKLSDEKRKSRGPTLVIAGKMSVENAPCNIAQFDLNKQEWSLEERIQLSLYNSYSGGEVYMLLANHTQSNEAAEEDTDGQKKVLPRQRSSSPSASTGSGELLVVGAFDTTYRNSQVTYCSVGMWDGGHLQKVGEGLCNSALSKGMKITTAALAGPYDVYVAGSFQTQVWSGDRHEFVKIFNIAHFNAKEQVWLPLNIGQTTCSWCTVTVLALAWDSNRRQLHVAGKFNSIDGRNVPAGLALYDFDSGRLVAHPGGGLTMRNASQDGVATALQLDEESGVLYVMGSFERLTASYDLCLGLAAYEIETNRWTCLADAAHTVLPSGGSNMLLTQYGLMVAGKTTESTTWPNADRPYTIALLKSTLKTKKDTSDDDALLKKSTLKTKKDTGDDDDDLVVKTERYRDFNWSWLPGFDGHDDPLHALANGFGDYQGSVFIAGDNLVAKWSYEASSRSGGGSGEDRRPSSSSTQPKLVPKTAVLSAGHVRGAIMAISQMAPDRDNEGGYKGGSINITIIVYCVSVGCVIGVIGAILCNRNISAAIFPFMGQEKDFKGFSLDTLTYSALENTNIMEAYKRAMETRYVQHPHLLTIIDPQEIFLQRIIGEGSFGRVWNARWRSASVAVKEFVFAQAAVAGRSSMQQEIVEEIIGEAGMMAILRHPNVLQLFGCSLTAQAIWIVSELCSLGSLRQLLDGSDIPLPMETRLSIALQVAEGMCYLHNQDPPIIHRDLKSHNIFINETFIGSEDASVSSVKQKKGKDSHDHYEKLDRQSTLVAKIGDWGSARATLSGSRTMTHGVGTACWLAPEVIKHARSSKFSDVYGYGIILWELATREEVYQGLETTQIIAKVANENLRPPVEAVPDDCPWKELMKECWAENPLERVNFTSIVSRLDAIQEKSRSKPSM
jgi:hypothetical protein